MQNKAKGKVVCILTGILAGVLMALIMILVMQETGYSLSHGSFAIAVCISAALPWCTHLLKSHGFSMALVQFVMIVSSYLITLLYGYMISSGTSAFKTTFTQIVIYVSIVHAVSLISVIVYQLTHRTGASHDTVQ